VVLQGGVAPRSEQACATSWNLPNVSPCRSLDGLDGFGSRRPNLDETQVTVQLFWSVAAGFVEAPRGIGFCGGAATMQHSPPAQRRAQRVRVVQESKKTGVLPLKTLAHAPRC
jgi:hypothetical protein